MLAASAGGAEPGHRDALAEREVSAIGPQGLDQPHALMTGNERRIRLHRPVTVRGVDVGVTGPRSLHQDADLAGARPGIGTLLDGQGLTERSYDCCLHGGSPRMVARVR